MILLHPHLLLHHSFDYRTHSHFHYHYHYHFHSHCHYHCCYCLDLVPLRSSLHQGKKLWLVVDTAVGRQVERVC